PPCRGACGLAAGAAAGAPRPRPRAGAGPSGTICALVTAALSNLKVARLSQRVADAGAPRSMSDRVRIMGSSFQRVAWALSGPAATGILLSHMSRRRSSPFHFPMVAPVPEISTAEETRDTETYLTQRSQRSLSADRFDAAG